MPASVVFVRLDETNHHRTWITREDGTSIGATLHVLHDLPHLVVESALALTDGLWASLTSTGEYPGLTPGHRRAKAITNAIANRFDDGPNTAAGVRERLRGMELEPLDDVRIELAILATQGAYARWRSTPTGSKLELAWPLPVAELEALASDAPSPR